ncbi:hypothetical protein [Methylomicrobium album]|uniref:hypothetical protein n=1 Tax=Methylomicrobium album TaxID=39775 RepID=UPI001FE160B5|nr:hypothetical protein [Methylomicrobium album]
MPTGFRELGAMNQALLYFGWPRVGGTPIGFRPTPTRLLRHELETPKNWMQSFCLSTSPQYQEWKRSLHHFYNPFPIVEHYELVLEQNA